ncbi:MAG: hypothetical protein Q9223_004381, partial [Gallowayella weberi]
MVRLSRMTDSDDDLPELSTILAEHTVFAPKERACSSNSPNRLDSSKHHNSSTDSERWNTKSSQEGKTGKPKQRSLKVAHVNSILFSLTNSGLSSPETRHKPKNSPPRLKSPSRSPPTNRAVTPPRSPNKLKLPSLAKNLRIPPSPHRPSVDAFWSQEVINDWNDQYSPTKTPKSSCVGKLTAPDDDDAGYFSPSQTGNRSPSRSPCKKDKQAAERRKTFNEKKYDLAVSFLQELDRKITNGQIADLTESTGGVHLVWSKKLQSTAGRANWKREALRSKDGGGKVFTATRYRHHASIELAEKVIDDEDRLVNVIAHEYCHLLNFMISNVKDNPHGKEFKAWANKCSTAFAHRGVNVTTTHVYEISYKYIWACSKCATEYKRHSKSIDPARHSCGKCHAKLVQIKPVPRGEGKGM